jgi:hypothetical protein
VSALLKGSGVHAQMRKAFAGILSRCYRPVAALKSCCEDSRFSAAVVIALGILSSLLMAFPIFLSSSHPS